jgi:hypothetical protein
MKVKIFMNSAGHNSEYEILRRFGYGIEQELKKKEKFSNRFLNFDKILKKGKEDSVEYDYADEYSPCDVAVIFGSWKPRSKDHHITRNSVADAAPVFVVIETPLLTRRVFQPNQYYRMGVNGFLNHSAHWNALDCPSTRFEEMGLEWNGWAEDLDDRAEIMIALQLAGDASLRGNNIVDWCMDTIRRIRKFTDEPIRIRTHPGISEKGWENYSDMFRDIAFGDYGDIRFSNGRERPWEDDIVNARCVVAYSSGMSIDAVMSGVPVIACDEGNFAWDISSNFPEDVVEPKLEDPETVKQWLYNLAYCQWSEEEMQNGNAWRHLLPAIETATKDNK